MQQSDTQITLFLRSLSDSIESNQLGPQQLERVSDFFMSYQFQEQAIKDRDNSMPKVVLFKQQDLVQFLTMGWYIYQLLLQKNTLDYLE